MAEPMARSELPCDRDVLALLLAAARHDIAGMASIVCTCDPFALSGLLVDTCLAQGRAMSGSEEAYADALEATLRTVPPD